MLFFLDASAIMKRYYPERGAGTIEALLSSSPATDRFYVSELSLLEVTAGIVRRVAPGVVASDALAQFRHDSGPLFHVRPLGAGVLEVALQVDETYRLRSGDAIQLGTALHSASISAPIPIIMVTSDRELLAAARQSGLTTLDPTHPTAMAQLQTLRAAP